MDKEVNPLTNYPNQYFGFSVHLHPPNEISLGVRLMSKCDPSKVCFIFILHTPRLKVVVHTILKIMLYMKQRFMCSIFHCVIMCVL